MTKTEFDALKMVVPGAMPFAAGDNATVTPAGATTGDFSMPDGFGSAFDAAPTADGSNMVQRGQMNFIGKMASYAPFMGQAGRDFWGFDPDVCVALGGYPKDAILTLVRDGCYLKIISLQDENKVDFTGGTDTTQTKYADIVNGTVDGVNWQYLSLDPQTLIDQSIIAEIPNMIVERELTQVIGVFKSYNDAALVISGGLDVNIPRDDVQTDSEEEKSVTYHYAMNIIVSEGYDSLEDLRSAKWKPVTTSSGGTSSPNGTVIFNLGTTSRDTEAFVTEKDKCYAIGFYAYAYKQVSGQAGFQPLPITISASTLKIKLAVF